MALSIKNSKDLAAVEGVIKAITIQGRNRTFKDLEHSANESDAPYFWRSFRTTQVQSEYVGCFSGAEH